MAIMPHVPGEFSVGGSWLNTDPELGSYEMTVSGKKYKAQRTQGDTVALWEDDMKLGVFSSLRDAAKFLTRDAHPIGRPPWPWG